MKIVSAGVAIRRANRRRVDITVTLPVTVRHAHPDTRFVDVYFAHEGVGSYDVLNDELGMGCWHRHVPTNEVQAIKDECRRLSASLRRRLGKP